MRATPLVKTLLLVSLGFAISCGEQQPQEPPQQPAPPSQPAEQPTPPAEPEAQKPAEPTRPEQPPPAPSAETPTPPTKQPMQPTPPSQPEEQSPKPPAAEQPAAEIPAPPAMTPTAPAPTTMEGDATAGAGVYAKKCATCHGPGGEGKESIAKMFKVELRPLGSKEVQAKSDADLRKDITEGIGKMKPVKGLSDDDLSNLVAFMRTLK